MVYCISFGKFRTSFWYLFLSIVFKVINDMLYGFNHNNNTFKDVKLFNDDVQNSLSKHIILHNAFNYFGTFILAFAYYQYDKYEITIPLVKEEKSKRKKTIVKLIHHNAVKNFRTRKSFIFFLIIIFLWIFQEQMVNLFMRCLKDLDFWMVEIFIISIITSKMFKLQIYKHQWLAILLNIIPCILKITAISLSFYDNSEDSNKYESNLPILYRLQKVYIPLGIITFLMLIIIRSYVNSKMKWYMDLKYISLRKFLIIYGLMGSLICTFICLITTYNECTISKYKFEEDNKIGMHNYICPIQDNKTNYLNESLTYEYLDNFKIYFKAFKHIEILKEIIVIIFGIITFFFNKYFTLLSIKYLTPVHIVFTTPIYFLFQKTCMIFYTLFSEQSFFMVNNKIKKKKFFLDISGDISSFFGFLIYLEIIIFNCKGFNYNININIAKRGYYDSKGAIDVEESFEGMNENSSEEWESYEFTELT